MEYRFELKYLLDYRAAELLKHRLYPFLQPDYHANSGNEYQIRSLYFDDAKNTDLFAKLAGLSERKKYRLRMYNLQTDLIRLEKKIKHTDMTAKLQEQIPLKTAQSLANGNVDVLSDFDDMVSVDMYRYHRLHYLRPSVITDYHREAYLFAPGNVRITFDTQLKTGLLNTDFFDDRVPLVPAIGYGQTVLEVKYDHYLPGVIRELLSGIDGVCMSVSKYALCKKFITYNDWEVQA
jgi:hypothetical protein